MDAEAFKVWRLARKLTQDDVARYLGRTRGTVAFWETKGAPALWGVVLQKALLAWDYEHGRRRGKRQVDEGPDLSTQIQEAQARAEARDPDQEQPVNLADQIDWGWMQGEVDAELAAQMRREIDEEIGWMNPSGSYRVRPEKPD